MKRILDLELDNIKLKERIIVLEQKLEKRTDDQQAARKETNKLKRELEKLRAEQNIPMVKSHSLNVRLSTNLRVFSYFGVCVYVCLCMFRAETACTSTSTAGEHKALMLLLLLLPLGQFQLYTQCVYLCVVG